MTVDLAVGTATGTVGIDGIENVTGGAGDDALLGALSGLLIDLGAGGDTLDFSALASNLTVTVHAAGGLTITDGVNTVTNIAGVENILGGSGTNTYVFEDGAALVGTISGGSTVLDYSSYTTAVTVDLEAGTATGTGGVGGLVGVTAGTAGDTLVGPAAGAAWNITGAISGSVAGVAFSNIENLQGAANNEDTFVFKAEDSLSGLVDGGDGGFDTIVLDGGTFDTVSFVATGPESGSIARDSDVLTYSGMEPLVAQTITMANVELTFNDTPQTITIMDSGTAGDGMMTVVSSESENPIFAVPTDSLTINAGSGADTIIIQSFDDAFGTNNTDLVINAGGGNDIIEVWALAGSGDYTLDGGTGSDSLEIAAGAFDTITYNVGGPDSGTIDFDDGVTTRTIAYSELASITDSSSAATRIFNGTDSGETIRLIDDSGTVADRATIDSDMGSSFTPITFANPSGALQIDAKGGGDTITVASLDPDFMGEKPCVVARKTRSPTH